ncbi:MAG TPA: ribonuclease III [Chitinispirillaceae bacterium]|nr:ribonuclease III [Chitinispirillaceae bacterium]
MKPLKLATDLFRAVLRSVRKATSEGSVDSLQKKLGYRFSSSDLLKQALTHKSASAPEDIKGLLSNERLEFLGDAVLNCLVTEHLYLSNPDKSEGQLSKVKSLVVSRKILGEVALSLDLGDYLIFGLSEVKAGGKNRQSTISNAFEALIGAVYLDGGLNVVRDILQKFLFSRIAEFLRDERNTNYKSKILELAQKDGFGIPRYTTIASSGPDHAKEFQVRIDIAGIPRGEGTGPNKKIAQQNAAQMATLNYSKEEILSQLKGEVKDELLSD